MPLPRPPPPQLVGPGSSPRALSVPALPRRGHSAAGCRSGSPGRRSPGRRSGRCTSAAPGWSCRALPYWTDQVVPDLRTGEVVLVAVLLTDLLLVLALQGAVVALVEPPAALHRDPVPVGGVKGQVRARDGAAEQRGVHDVRRDAGGRQQLTAASGLGQALLGEGDVHPTGEQVLRIPATLAMAEQHKGVGHASILPQLPRRCAGTSGPAVRPRRSPRAVAPWPGGTPSAPHRRPRPSRAGRHAGSHPPPAACGGPGRRAGRPAPTPRCLVWWSSVG